MPLLQTRQRFCCVPTSSWSRVASRPQVESHVLSVDVEDWFQVENYAHAIRRDEWPRCELRVADNVHRLLDLLAGTNARGTFRSEERRVGKGWSGRVASA